MEPSIKLVDELLSTIEQIELRSFQWGHVDGSMSEDQIDSLSGQIISENGSEIDPEDLVDLLVDKKLLFQKFQGNVPRYRSRFAEGVRLLTRLKQVFPNKPWPIAPDLVSNYRVSATPRRFPKRDIEGTQVLQELKNITRTNPLSENVLSQLISGLKLSGFQLRTAKAVLRDSRYDTATVLTSGTGSGKTLAFLIPTLLEIAPLIRRNEHWTKVIALYPRNELLKDQFLQTYKVASSINGTLVSSGKRPVILGTLFAETPYTASLKGVTDAKWDNLNNGYVCPFLSCPTCASLMIWPREAIEQGQERLECSIESCTKKIGPDEVILTRTRAKREPPDFLFTTSEMLNRRLSDSSSHRLLGINQPESNHPRVLLLDEIHTYSGIHGAQTGLVLRRWRNSVRRNGRKVKYIGLSATIEEPERFMSELTGIYGADVAHAYPREKEFQSSSMEYQLVLQGDPVSKTALLSTTIQVSFLLRRLLDTDSGSINQDSFYGYKLFAFTDDLDATNRLLDSLRDSEGFDVFGRGGINQPLAALRATSTFSGNRNLAERAGQIWQSVEQIGHNLRQRLKVTRVSSQDRGVNSDSDVIVATASLEVGYNDERVGAIIQHKSPIQMSSFVQRKGRAGRTTIMRPWTVTVLSDYGRDRVMFQNYDRLFSPVLNAQFLPIKNRYVLRMQAAFALIDWLAHMNSDTQAWWWQPLDKPAQPNESRKRNQQQKIKSLLTAVLEGDQELQSRLASYIKYSLKLGSDEDLENILWGRPRSLMLDVIPTILRRLETNWELFQEINGRRVDRVSESSSVHPLPEFIPSNLFSDLNVPEVRIDIPPATSNSDPRHEYMDITASIRRLAPGRVTRRFAPERRGLNHWIPVPLKDGIYHMKISDYSSEAEYVTHVATIIDNEPIEIPCYRPHVFSLMTVNARQINDTSNGEQVWGTEITPTGDPAEIDTEADVDWGHVLKKVTLYMHNLESPVIIKRFSTGAISNVRTAGTNPQEFNVETRYTDDFGYPAGIGFEQDVDAILFTFKLPDVALIKNRASLSSSSHHWKSAFLKHLLENDEELGSYANQFLLDWLYQIYFATLIELAVTQNKSILEAAELIFSDSSQSIRLDDVLNRIMANSVQNPIEQPGPSANANTDSIAQRLAHLIHDQRIKEILFQQTKKSFDPNSTEWNEWIVSSIHGSLGEACLDTVFHIAPTHIAEDAVLMDLYRGVPSPNQSTIEIWISESSLGGSGAIEALANSITDDPSVLFSGLNSAISLSELELTTQGLDRFVIATNEDERVAECSSNVRSSIDHENIQTTQRSLFEKLSSLGISCTETFKISLNHRIFREGTDHSSDLLLKELLETWKTWEERLQVSIDLRTFADVVSINSPLAGDITNFIETITGVRPNGIETGAILSGVLWPRVEEVREKIFNSYNPFTSRRGFTDPKLIRDLLFTDDTEITGYGDTNWREDLINILSSSRKVKFHSNSQNISDFQKALFELLAESIDMDYLQFHPSIAEIERDQDDVVITLELGEAR